MSELKYLSNHSEVTGLRPFITRGSSGSLLSTVPVIVVLMRGIHHSPRQLRAHTFFHMGAAGMKQNRRICISNSTLVWGNTWGTRLSEPLGQPAWSQQGLRAGKCPSTGISPCHRRQEPGVLICTTHTGHSETYTCLSENGVIHLFSKSDVSKFASSS